MSRFNWKVSLLTLVALNSCGKSNLSYVYDTTTISPIFKGPQRVWLKKNEIVDPSILNVIAAINLKTGLKLTESDFKMASEVEQAHSNYVRFDQMKAGTLVDKSNIRIWTELKSGNVLQVDAYVTDTTAVKPDTPTDFVAPLKLVQKDLAEQFSKNQILSTKVYNVIAQGQLVRRVEITSKAGFYTFDFHANIDKIVSKKFKQALTNETYSMDADVYPLYENLDSYMMWPESAPEKPLNRVPAKLENILSRRHDIDWKVTLNAMSQAPLSFSKYRPVGPLSLEEQAKGFWNDTVWYERFPSFAEQNGKYLPNIADGNYGSAAHLIGKNVGIFMHPKASIAPAQKRLGGAFWPMGVSRGDDFVLYPKLTFLGLPFFGPNDLKNRAALDENNEVKSEDTAWLMKQGFDEVQVYYAVDRFMEQARTLGFTDKGSSTQPFAAVLFDPDIEYRDNAYYWQNTINFTTYTKGNLNYARDNSTIWHELGHGLQDRLMGSWAAEGVSGLSEGMADTLAQLIVFGQLGKASFENDKYQRINNNTWFNVTNETHDDGEAYGGAMNDFTLKAIKRWGFLEGLARSSDLIFETMRFTRDNPAVNQDVWFEEMKYVDSLTRSVAGAPNRKPGEMSELINAALTSRNYSPGKLSADMKVLVGENEILTSESTGSYSKPFEFKADGTRQKVSFKVSFKDGETTQFQFPVTLRVVYFRMPGSVGPIPFDGWEQKSRDITFNSADEEKEIVQEFDAKCDFSNQGSGGCRAALLLQAYKEGQTLLDKPITKKRLVVKLN